jgi:hypothetical protein
LFALLPDETRLSHAAFSFSLLQLISSLITMKLVFSNMFALMTITCLMAVAAHDDGLRGTFEEARSLVAIGITNVDFANAVFGSPLAPDDYASPTGISLVGDIYLDNTGSNANGDWIFTVDSLTAAASCKMLFKDPTGGGTVTWNVNGVIFIGAAAEMIGTMTSDNGAITLGANAKSGDLITDKGAIGLGAAAHSGDLTSGAAITLGANAQCNEMQSVAAVTLGAGAIVNGQIDAGAAITLGAGSDVKGQVKAGAAITVGAGSTTCALCAGAAITLGAGATLNALADCNLPSSTQFCSVGSPTVCAITIPASC